MRAWHSLDCHGQTGGDGGRDIVGVCEGLYGARKTVVVACENWKAFTLAKAASDMDHPSLSHIYENESTKTKAAIRRLLLTDTAISATCHRRSEIGFRTSAA